MSEQVERMIVQDAKGRVISVRADRIPKGSTILRKDVPPGVSLYAADRTVSEMKNAPKQDTIQDEDDRIAEIKAQQEQGVEEDTPDAESNEKKKK